jgi:hypothetical protein
MSNKESLSRLLPRSPDHLPAFVCNIVYASLRKDSMIETNSAQETWNAIVQTRWPLEFADVDFQISKFNPTFVFQKFVENLEIRDYTLGDLVRDLRIHRSQAEAEILENALAGLSSSSNSSLVSRVPNDEKAAKVKVTERKKSTVFPRLATSFSMRQAPHCCVDRNDYIDKLNKAFDFGNDEPDSKSRRVLLYGLSGSGKSTIAFAFAKANMPSCACIGWIFCGEGGTVQSVLQSLHEGLTGRKPSKDRDLEVVSLEDVYDDVENYDVTASGRILLIIDDFDLSKDDSIGEGSL